MTQRYSIAQTMVPLTTKTPLNPSEGWKFDYTREAGYQAAMMGKTDGLQFAQSDNYRYYNEPCYKEMKNNCFNHLTGLEPIFGHMTYPLNKLNQEQTNRRGLELQRMTQIETPSAPFTQDPVRYMVNQPEKYPWLKGRPWYTIGLNGILGQ